MKKFLEVLVDDNGKFSFFTDFEFPDSFESSMKEIIDYMKNNQTQEKNLIECMVEEVWKNRSIHFSKAIRILAVADIMTCAEPYELAENFWWDMMFEYIPKYEKYASSLKKPYGYDETKMTRPIVGSPMMSMMNLNKKPS